MELISGIEGLSQVNKKTTIHLCTNTRVLLSVLPVQPRFSNEQKERLVLKHKPGIKSQLWRIWKSFVNVTDTRNGWDVVKEKYSSPAPVKHNYGTKEIYMMSYMINTGYGMYRLTCGYDNCKDDLYIKEFEEYNDYSYGWQQ